MNPDKIITKKSKGLVEHIGIVSQQQKPSNEVFPCGIKIFDDAMDGGFRGGDVVVVSGETSQGKTTFSQYMTIMQSEEGVPSIWFSYEMSTYYLGEQFNKMGVDVNDEDFLVYAPKKLDKWSIMNSISIIRESISEYACKFVFIDHLHYLIPLNESKNTSLMVGGVLRELKSLAVELDVVIVLLAHTKKLGEDEELTLNSMRDSSLIAQEADSVFLVQRLKQPKKRMMVEVSGSKYTNQTKIELAKVRRTGRVCYQVFDFVNHRYKIAENVQSAQSIIDAIPTAYDARAKKFPKGQGPYDVG